MRDSKSGARPFHGCQWISAALCVRGVQPSRATCEHHVSVRARRSYAGSMRARSTACAAVIDDATTAHLTKLSELLDAAQASIDVANDVEKQKRASERIKNTL